MKIKHSTAFSDMEKPDLIRALVLGFRTKTLTLADHRKISNWLDESEQNQQLFEKWITDPEFRVLRNDENRVAKFSTYRTPRSVWIFFLLFVAGLIACVIYLINR
ncbi:MAG: hypothetical protein EOO09_00850 [Chitinophagaceae bacterium]|nr:MAG: hypothetical protein EOO09_00850 [Chitinophagaceae bacterium]